MLPGSKKPMTEKEIESRRPNLRLQMAPAPFFGLVAPDLCGNRQLGLLGEPGEGNFGSGSWAKTWPNKHSHIYIFFKFQLEELKMAHLQTRAWSSQSLCWQNAPQYLASVFISLFVEKQ